MHIKGLLEMMFDKLAGWTDEFILDMEVGLQPQALKLQASYILSGVAPAVYI